MTQNGRFGITVLALGLTLGVTKVTAVRGYQPLVSPLETIDFQIDGWRGASDPPLDPVFVQSLAATSYLSRTYRRDNLDLNLWIAFYANQQAGETMHSPKYCLPGQGWEMLMQESLPLTVNGRTVSVNDYVLDRPGERMRMLYWYQGQHRIIASEYSGKLWLMWDALRYGQTSGSIVRVLLPDDASVRPKAVAFAGQVMDRLAHCFGE